MVKVVDGQEDIPDRNKPLNLYSKMIFTFWCFKVSFAYIGCENKI